MDVLGSDQLRHGDGDVEGLAHREAEASPQVQSDPLPWPDRRVAKTGGASLTANHRAAEAFLISAGQLVTSVKPDWFCTVTRTAKRLPSGAMSYGGES